jgi:flavin reductase (DIM6/NTAB) family NADH-FMN oxidoreductase RutF
VDHQLTERTGFPAPATADLAAAWGAWAGAVTLVTVADGRDDIGATISSFSLVSAEPPLVLLSLISGSYPAELFSRPDEPVARFAVTLLSAGQRMLAGRFAASGRPGARLMLDDVPHRRGPGSGALIVEGGLAALECSAQRLITAGDHLLVLAEVTGVMYVAGSGEPLIRFRGRYVLARGDDPPEPPVRFAPRCGARRSIARPEGRMRPLADRAIAATPR